MISAISVPAQCRASMARKATLGRSAHMVKALKAATQAGPSFMQENGLEIGQVRRRSR